MSDMTQREKGCAVRQAIGLFKWPDEYMTTIYEIYTSTVDHKARVALVKEQLPNLESEYEQATGRGIFDMEIHIAFVKARRNVKERRKAA